MARYVQNVVHAAGDPEVAIFIATSAVAAEIHIFEGGEVGLFKALVVAEQGSRLSRPGVGDGQVTFGRALQRSAFIVDQHRLHAEERTRGGTRFQLNGARQRSNHEATGFSLPPGIHHRTFLVANLLPVPLPGFRVNRLADRAQNTQRRAIGAFDGLIAFRHQRTDRRRRGVENIDLVLIDDLTHPRRRRPVRHPFKHQRGGAAGQRAVQQIAVAGHPAYVGSTPVDVARMVVEDIFEGGGGIDQVAAGGVQHPFGLTG